MIKNDQYQLKHADLLFSFAFAGRLPDTARNPDGLNKGHCFYAFFVPECFPAICRRKKRRIWPGMGFFGKANARNCTSGAKNTIFSAAKCPEKQHSA
jgi:hypothetical protein